MEIQRETTEYIYIGVTGDIPVSAEVAFLEAPDRPDELDWEEATIVDDQHDLWGAASSTGLAGDYFLARLVGSFGDNDVVLSPGDYAVWVRLTDVTERPVRIAPITLEVQ